MDTFPDIPSQKWEEVFSAMSPTIVQCILVVYIGFYKAPMQATGPLVEINNKGWLVDLTAFYKVNKGLPHTALVQYFDGNNCLVKQGVLPYGN